MTINDDEHGIEGRISALLDGELDAEERDAALAALDDEVQRHRWGRYHLIGEALRGNTPPLPEVDLAGRVMNALAEEAAEPVWIRERPPEVPTPTVRRWDFGWLRPAAGLAMAASVGAAAVLVATPHGGNEAALPQVAEAPAAMTQVAATPVAAAAATPRPVMAPVKAEEWRRLTPRRDDLGPYVVNHHLHAGGSTVPAVQPYIRMVGYEAR